MCATNDPWVLESLAPVILEHIGSSEVQESLISGLLEKLGDGVDQDSEMEEYQDYMQKHPKSTMKMVDWVGGRSKKRAILSLAMDSTSCRKELILGLLKD